MEFKIKVEKLEDGGYMATVDWNAADGGKVGTPGLIAYGESEDEAYKFLNKKLENKGHKVLN
jgi:hypothetical protein